MRRYRINEKWWDGKRRHLYNPDRVNPVAPDDKTLIGTVDVLDSFVEPEESAEDAQRGHSKMTYLGYVDANGNFFPGREPPKVPQEDDVYSVEDTSLDELTKKELVERATAAGIPGAHVLNKAQLVQKLSDG